MIQSQKASKYTKMGESLRSHQYTNWCNHFRIKIVRGGGGGVSIVLDNGFVCDQICTDGEIFFQLKYICMKFCIKPQSHRMAVEIRYSAVERG